MKRDKESQELFADITKDIVKQFQKGFNRGFWSGIILGLAVIGLFFLLTPWLWVLINSFKELNG